jgi:hypothetical protein
MCSNSFMDLYTWTSLPRLTMQGLGCFAVTAYDGQVVDFGVPIGFPLDPADSPDRNRPANAFVTGERQRPLPAAWPKLARHTLESFPSSSWAKSLPALYSDL